MPISHPFRRGRDGALVTVAEGSLALAAQLAGHVLATRPGERPLAPQYGLGDPVADALDPVEVAHAVQWCEPEVAVVDVRLSADGDRTLVEVDVTWAEEPSDG